MTDLERDATEVIAGLTPLFEAGQGHTDPLEYIEVLHDRGAIIERFAELSVWSAGLTFEDASDLRVRQAARTA